MAETVGRVDYIANLDGRDLPRQVRQMGDRAGKDFSKSFDRNMRNTFDRQITDAGDRAAAALSKKGKLAGERFATTFDRATSSKFRRIQENLANILSDRDSFAKYARGFDTVGDAVQRVEEDLKRLRDEDVKFQDSIGRTRTGVVLTKDDLNRFSAEAKRMGIELERMVAKEDEAAAATARMRDRVTELESQHRLLQRRIGNVGAFDRYAQRVGGTSNAFRDLSRQIDEMGSALGHTNADMEISRDRLLQVRTASDKATTSLDRQGDSVERLGFHWNDLSHNTRQWTLIIGAVAAGIQDLAVLSSAAGAGIVALGGALGAGVVGLGGFVTAFSVLNKDLKDLPPSMHGVVTEFQSFKGAASGVRDIIASSAFQQMPNSFSKLEGTLGALSPEFSRLGTVVGRTFDDLANGLQEGTTGFKVLQGFISNGTENFSSLAQVSGTWSVALLRAMNRANPMVEQLIGYVGTLGDRFDAFTRSRDFDDWVSNSMVTMRKFGQLLDATGRALNDLVTPASIARTQKFLDNLTGFMPNLGRLLDTIGRLDVFGLAAEMLNKFGSALEPLEGPLGDLAEALNRIGSSAISNLANALGAVSSVIAPLVQNIADFVNAIPPEALDVITGSVLALAGAFVVLKGANGIAGLAQSLTTSLTSMGSLSTAMASTTTTASGLAGTLGGIASKLGPIGLAVAATTQELTVAIPQMKGLDSATMGLGGRMTATGEQVTMLSDKLRVFADQNLVTRSAARDFEASIDALTQSLTDNGTTLDISTEKGRANQAALDAVASSTLRLSDETLKQTGSQQKANDVIAAGREQLVRQIEKLTGSADAANKYADELGLIPKVVNTDAQLRGDAAVKKKLDDLTKDRTVTIRGVLKGIDGSFLGGRQYEFATGGTVTGPTRALIGEAGPEAVVPLNRPLAQVDPSVRALSAIAQGKMPALAGGGIAGAQSKTVIFEAGAIVVQGADDPRRAALEVADEVADRIGS